MKRILEVLVILLALSCVGWAQTTSAKTQITTASKCQPVTPKNAQELVMIEQSSNKNGCWVRNQVTGRLEFVGNSPTDYKPLLHDTPKLPTPRPPASTGTLAGSPVGQWSVTFTNTLNRGRWEKGTVVITPTLEVQWKCEAESAFDLNSVSWTDTPTSCVSPNGIIGGGSCNWKLTENSPGVYGVACTGTENKAKGYLTIEGTTIKGNVVNNGEYTISFSGSRFGIASSSTVGGSPLSDKAPQDKSLAKETGNVSTKYYNGDILRVCIDTTDPKWRTDGFIRAADGHLFRYSSFNEGSCKRTYSVPPGRYELNVCGPGAFPGQTFSLSAGPDHVAHPEYGPLGCLINGKENVPPLYTISVQRKEGQSVEVTIKPN